MLRVVMDELQFFYDHGAVMVDGYQLDTIISAERERFGQVDKVAARQMANVRVHAKLVSFGSDYRGIEKFLCLQGTPALNACFKCWIKGYRVRFKTVFTNNFTFLPLDDPLRDEMAQLNTATNSGACWDPLSAPPRRRTAFEMRYGAQQAWPLHLQPQVNPDDLYIDGRWGGQCRGLCGV
jgi:hypothetical protein